MESYAIYLDLLRGGGLAVPGLLAWTGIGLSFFLLVGFWLPLALEHRGLGVMAEAGEGGRAPWTAILPLALGSGLATAVTAWTLSLLAFASFGPGNLALAGAALAGAGLAFRGRKHPSRPTGRSSAWIALSIFALALGLWQHAATELPVELEAARLVFSDLQRDLGAHVAMAGLVHDGGLPMQNFWGSEEHAYWALSHSGHLVLIAGLSDAVGVTLYRAATVLWILASLLMAWGAWGLLQARRLSGAARCVIAGGALVWGALAFPEVHRIYDPLRAAAGGGFELDAPGYWVAGRGFWNLPQALSIALTMAGVMVLDGFAAERRRGRSAGRMLLIAGVFLLVAGGWTKPSLIIFYGPALLAWLALNRAGTGDFGCVLLLLTGGTFLYALPAILFELPRFPGWTALFDPDQWRTVGGFVLRASPGLAVLAAAPLLRLLKQRGGQAEFRVLDLALVAAGGSLLFALCFREEQFVGFRFFQPNLWWGLSGCTVLLVPLLGRDAFEGLRAGGWRRGAASAGLALSLLHVFNGLCLAVAYPVLNLRGHLAQDAETLAAARAQTPPGARFALDSALQDYDLLGYLSRPALMPPITGAESHRADFEAWQSFSRGAGGPEGALLDRLDAVVVSRVNGSVAAHLAALGWTRQALPGDYELWQPPQS